jgi:hypothetical protein
MKSNFEILRGGPGTVSGVLPSATHPIGRPLKISAIDADTGEKTFVVADGWADGFCMKAIREDSTAIGRTDTEQLYGLAPDDSGGQIPYRAGFHGSIEMAEALEVEGSDYIVSTGTGAIYAGTAADTLLSFTAGKFCQVQSTQRAQYRLVAQLTPNTSGAVRISVEILKGDLTA